MRDRVRVAQKTPRLRRKREIINYPHFINQKKKRERKKIYPQEIIMAWGEKIMFQIL